MSMTIEIFACKVQLSGGVIPASVFTNVLESNELLKKQQLEYEIQIKDAGQQINKMKAELIELSQRLGNETRSFATQRNEYERKLKAIEIEHDKLIKKNQENDMKVRSIQSERDEYEATVTRQLQQSEAKIKTAEKECYELTAKISTLITNHTKECAELKAKMFNATKDHTAEIKRLHEEQERIIENLMTEHRLNVKRATTQVAQLATTEQGDFCEF